TGVVKMLLGSGKYLADKVGVELKLTRIAEKDLGRPKKVGVPQKLVTDDAQAVLNDPDVHVIVELVGGYHPAKEFILTALSRGKDVVTANKALLALHGTELFRKAREVGRSISFEASVGGGIPIIAAVRDGFVANRIQAIYGIVNGTCNYILTKMSREGMSYKDALAEAQAHGYAEKDPTLDVDGTDSTHKLAVLGRLGFGVDFDYEAIHREGISDVEFDDMRYAAELGYTLKLLAIAKQHPNGLELRVHPTLLPKDHPLAAVSGVFNAICVNGDAVGETMLYGRGAGQMPTASAVTADLVDVALGRARTTFEHMRFFSNRRRKATVLDMAETKCRYYLRFSALDKPGVLSKVAGVLGKHHISIASVIQQDRREGQHVPLVLTTHIAVEGNVRKALREIDKLAVVGAKSRFLRVEGVED
ncbi:MAG: homoserine dehydrogenase, partial [Planctomycetes bacterium]|nr:homoserine dehydrogenase [Planctomycetota bacterium]